MTTVTTPVHCVRHFGYRLGAWRRAAVSCACVEYRSGPPAQCAQLASFSLTGCLCPSWRLAFVTFGLFREFLAILPTLLYSTTPLGLFAHSALFCLFCVSGRGHQRLTTSPVSPSCLELQQFVVSTDGGCGVGFELWWDIFVSGIFVPSS